MKNKNDHVWCLEYARKEKVLRWQRAEWMELANTRCTTKAAAIELANTLNRRTPHVLRRDAFNGRRFRVRTCLAWRERLRDSYMPNWAGDYMARRRRAQEEIASLSPAQDADTLVMLIILRGSTPTPTTQS